MNWSWAKTAFGSLTRVTNVLVKSLSLIFVALQPAAAATPRSTKPADRKEIILGVRDTSRAFFDSLMALKAYVSLSVDKLTADFSMFRRWGKGHVELRPVLNID